MAADKAKSDIIKRRDQARRTVVALVVFFCLAFEESGQAATHYVSPKGNDSNPGTQLQPWKTLQHAANQARPGDQIIAKPGLYPNGLKTTKDGASKKNPTVFQSEIPHQAIIDGSTTGANIIVHHSHITIRGFKVQNVRYHDGITVVGTNRKELLTNVRIEGNYTYNTAGSGISAWGVDWEAGDPAKCTTPYKCISDLVITGNRVEAANNKLMDGGNNEFITIASGVDHVKIVGNQLTRGNIDPKKYEHEWGGEGIDLKEGVTRAYIFRNRIYDMWDSRYAIYIEGGGSTWAYPKAYPTAPGWLREIYVFANLITNNDGHGIGIVSEGSGNVENVYVFNNVINRVGLDGISLYDWNLMNQKNPPSPLPTYRNIFIFNNTIYQCGDDQINKKSYTPWFGGIGFDHHFGERIFAMFNITYQNNNNDLRKRFVSKGTIIRDNLAGVDPLFVDASSGNFHLRRGSPAIDRGSFLFPSHLRFDYNIKPRDKWIDLGAFEYQH